MHNRTISHCSRNICFDASIPLHHELQLSVGVLDLLLGLDVQHVRCVFTVDLENNVAGLQVSLCCLAAPVDLVDRRMSSVRSCWPEVLL